MLPSFGKKTASLVLVGLLLCPTLSYATSIPTLNNNPLLLTRIAESEIAKVVTQNTAVTLDGKSIDVRYVVVPKTANVLSDIALAQNSVGQIDELNNIATQSDALVAINGGFFQNFDTTKPMEPYGTLIKNGTLIHKGELSSVIGFTDDNSVKIGIIAPTVTATVGKTPIKVEHLNHTPSQDGSAVSVFTRARGDKVGFGYGTNIVINQREITQIVSNSNVSIPLGGYVINLTGDAVKQWKSVMVKGTKVSFATHYVNEHGTKVDWSSVQTAIGAGPILLKNGELAIDLSKEKYVDAKSTSMVFARSAVGVNAEGNILLVSGVNSTLEQMASVMQQLGAVNAICMDSGSSSGLYVNDQYLVKPSRSMSNALIFKINTD